jgi:lipoate-protein ligase B
VASFIAVAMGLVEYARAWELQRRLHQQVTDGRLPDLLLLLEHPHVYTLGRRGKASDILASAGEMAELGVEVHSTDRGGEVTYHGPGQLVAYPILDLRSMGLGPLHYVRTLERILVETLAEFGIRAQSGERPTGVWVGDAKIAAIGVKISRGVTMHGFALNVNSDLSYFSHIVPCGMTGGLVTSMERELEAEIRTREVVPVVARRFGGAFGREVEWASVEELGLQLTVRGSAKSGRATALLNPL